MKRPQFPRAAERAYARALRRRVAHLRDVVRDVVVAELPRLEAEARATGIVVDGLGDMLAALIARAAAMQARLGGIGEDAKKAAEQTASHGRREFERVVEHALPVTPFAREPFLVAAVDDFAAANIRAVKKLESDALSEIERVVADGFRQGKRSNAIAKDIQGRINIAGNRAKLIARNEVGNLSGQLNRLRQKNAGITTYRWITSRDERVRPDHADRHGKTFSWDDAPSDGHPGEPINCRCTASPVFED